MAVSFTLGPFQVDALLAVGGMGEVWRGTHVEQGIPVAVKVITNSLARRATYRASFRNEVRSVAGLSHPGVVLVLDHGEVNRAAEAATKGRMVAESPYLVMELATGGSLASSGVVATWRDLRRVLADLLDALAHAHARGVVHRDLKPGNVLLSGPADLRPGLKLADFGLAHAGESISARAGAAGTPRYMAPEQFLAQWRDYGPWTDLYAVGCLAWELATGTGPHPGRGYVTLRQAHLHETPRSLKPSPSLPRGYESWLRKLLEKDHRRRFQCAADAAYALARLPPPREPHRALPQRTERRRDNATFTVSAIPPPPPTLTFFATTSSDEDELEVMAPPLPASWRREEAPPPSPRLAGAGLGLWGLRAIPLVGRAVERDRIWEALHQVDRTGSARAVVVRGPAGIGKSSLAEWALHRAAELGGAQAVHTRHASGDGIDSLAEMLARHTSTVGLDHERVAVRIAELLSSQDVDDELECRSLADWICPSPQMHPAGPETRFALLRRYLTRLGRTVVFHIDDVQWGAESLRFARWLLRQQDESPSPFLLLLSIRDADAGPEVTAALESLIAEPHCSVLSLEPLPGAQTRKLVEELLLLDGKLASEVQSRARGNPMFAVQLVDDWIDREILEVGKRGFVLRPGERAAIPDDLYALWEAQLSGLISGTDRQALEVAALLGREVDDVLWRMAMFEAEVTEPDALVDRLVARRLATRGPDGWRMAHPMLRESLERSARESGHWSALNLGCARALQARYPAGGRRVDSSVGKHLVAAGELEEALVPLRTAARSRLDRADLSGAISMLRLHDRCSKELGLPNTHFEVAERHLLTVQLLVAKGRFAEAETRAGDIVRRMGSQPAGAHALCELGLCLLKRGALDEHKVHSRRAAALARAMGDAPLEARALGVMAEGARLQGRYREALSLAQSAVDLCQQTGDLRTVGNVLLLMGQAHAELGELDQAAELTRKARVAFDRTGNPVGAGAAINSLADWARRSGALAQAEEGYLEALDLLRALGSPDTLVPCLNLGIVRTERADYQGALDILRTGLALAERGGRRAWIGMAHALMLPAVAAFEDWAAFDDHLSHVERDLVAAGVVDGDVARALELAGVMAGRAQDERARKALTLAVEHWRGMGREDRVTTARLALDRLPA
ncbi:MAG: protein kinase [Proteobacteria bacterium]|nr:protein kinase [Pseudomonadota bacterium]MCP4917238.1 protein kinase [Pseudomonadota bacterium]